MGEPCITRRSPDDFTWMAVGSRAAHAMAGRGGNLTVCGHNLSDRAGEDSSIQARCRRCVNLINSGGGWSGSAQSAVAPESARCGTCREPIRRGREGGLWSHDTAGYHNHNAHPAGGGS